MIAQYSYSQVTGVCQLVTFIVLAVAAALCGIGVFRHLKRGGGKLTVAVYILAGVLALAGVSGLLCLCSIQNLEVAVPADMDSFATSDLAWMRTMDEGGQALVYINWAVVGSIFLCGGIIALALACLLFVLVRRLQTSGIKDVVASLIAIAIGLLVGSIITVISGLTNSSITGANTADAVKLISFGLFSTGRDSAGALTFGFNPQLMGTMLFRAMPLIMTGLSVALAQKTGLFNIGAPGQYLMGTMATLMIALSLPTGTGEALQNVSGQWLNHTDVLGAEGVVYPGWLVWTLAFLGGMLAGAIWGAIPGMLKALLNINEVLACIMTNWIAANLVTWAFDVSNFKNVVENTKMGYVYKTSFNGVETSKLELDRLLPGSQVSGGIIVAIIIALLVYILMNKTIFGYELKACGSNRFAARYAGIRDKRSIVISMALAGALAGAGAALYYLAGNAEFTWGNNQTLPAVGFNGIPVALLANNDPVGVIFSGMFMSMLQICGQRVKELTSFNEYITNVIIAVIVYLSAFSMLIRMLLNRKKHAGKEALK